MVLIRRRNALLRLVAPALVTPLLLASAGVGAAQAAGPGMRGGGERGVAPNPLPALTSAPLLATASQLASSGRWAELALQIGNLYLPAQLSQLFVRQMALESENFSPAVIDGRIVSPAGAQGIAQLMPASYPNVNRLDPVASLSAAAQTMRDNLQQFGGDMRKAVAAYNAGAGTVSSLTRRLGTAWESRLPWETRRYLGELLGASSV